MIFFCCFQVSYQALEALNSLFLIDFSPGTKANVFVLLRCKYDLSKYFHDFFQFLQNVELQEHETYPDCNNFQLQSLQILFSLIILLHLILQTMFLRNIILSSPYLLTYKSLFNLRKLIYQVISY